MSIDNLTVKESANVSLGQVGCFMEDGTNVISGKKIVAIQFITDTTFTTLTPNSTSYMGTSGGSGHVATGVVDTNNTFPTGMVLFGQWTAFTLATGSVIAYEGNF
jgi:hypothetical protein